MPMQPYVLVLAQTSHEGAKYVRRAKLPRGRWRVVAKASSIRGIRKAEVHCLPGFHKRPDKHSILGELRYAQCEWRDVEMPPAEVPDAVDQGDGMGEQLTIAELIAGPGATDESIKAAALEQIVAALDEEDEALAHHAAVADDDKTTEAIEAKISFNEETRGALGDLLAAKDLMVGVAPVPETPKARRRRKCEDCGALHFKDEDCVRIDGVEETPATVSTTAVIFD